MKEQLTASNFRLEYTPYINYAMTFVGTSYITACELINDDDEDWRDLIVSIKGEMLIPTESHISLVPKGQAITIPSIDIKPDLDKLRHLTESVDTQFVFTVKQILPPPQGEENSP